MQGMQWVAPPQCPAVGSGFRLTPEAAAKPVQSRGDEPRPCVFSDGQRRFEVMPVVEVRCFIAEQKYVWACGETRRILLSDSLRSLERELSGQFIRVHRNALVSRRHLRGLKRQADGVWRAQLADTRQSPAVSRRLVAKLKRCLIWGEA